jgi:hypothetical protein
MNHTGQNIPNQIVAGIIVVLSDGRKATLDFLGIERFFGLVRGSQTVNVCAELDDLAQ